jgi:hypothetical protein
MFSIKCIKEAYFLSTLIGFLCKKNVKEVLSNLKTPVFYPSLLILPHKKWDFLILRYFFTLQSI